jgi:two-component system, NarL family, nitrate/nitrite response regulator NarL
MIRVVVVDDHPMFRAGLIQTVTVDQDVSVVGEGSSAAEAVELVRSLQPDILLLDARMEDSGVDRIGDVLAAHPQVRVIMVTASEDDSDVARALEAGVSGYVLKGIAGTEMRAILRSVSQGESYIPQDMVGRLLSILRAGQASSVRQEPVANLSGQETQVLQALALGLNNREIGARLGVTERTVKFHLSNAFTKLKVRNRVEASIIARRMWPDLDR